jgi:hypothetical protein
MGGFGGGYSASHVGTWNSGHVGDWNGIGGWNGRAGNWNGLATGRSWDRSFWGGTHPWYGYRYGYGGFYPGYGLAWWPWWYSYGGWPGYYSYYDYYPYNNYTTYAYDSDTVPYADSEPIAESPMTNATIGEEQSEYYTEALAAFQQGDFSNAVRLAGHAAIDEPRNPDVHLLLSLGMFALGQYRGAAMEAHAVAAMGQIPDWAKVYAIYGNVETYTNQLRALEKYVSAHPKSPEGRFMLGFQYMIAGHPDAAKGELLQALNLTPQDRLAGQLLTKAGGTIPPQIARRMSPPTSTMPQGTPGAPGAVMPSSPSVPAMPQK